MIEIQTQKVVFDEKKVIQSLEKKALEVNFSIRDIMYYPYMFYEFSFQNSNPISPLKGDIGCTIDALSGVPALVDQQPNFTQLQLTEDRILPILLDKSQMIELAKEFLYRTISKKIKIISAPNLTSKFEELYYRPYWIVDGNEDQHTFTLMVDSITGKYHPLNLE